LKGVENMKKILNIFIVLMILISISSIVIADDNEENENEFEVDAGGDYKAMMNETIQFFGSADGGVEPYVWYWDFGDGYNSTEQNPTHVYSEEGKYEILLKVIDDEGNITTDDGEVEIENEEDLDIDDETEKEVEIINNSLGAEIRLLQLKKAIIKNLLNGEMAVEVLKGLDYNTTLLEIILFDMKNLLEDINTTNTSANDTVRIFVEFKIEAKNLTTRFRETIKDLLDDEKLREIRERIKNMVNEELENISKTIRNKIKQFNTNQLYKLYGIIGDENNSFINEYLNGNVSISEVKIQIGKTINQMNKEKKYEIFSEIKKENIQKKINAQASVDNLKNKGKGNGKGD
jgi:hypothetical protein